MDIVSGAVPSGVSIVYSNDENFINVNELLASAIKSLKVQVDNDGQNFNKSVDEINTKLETKENVSNKVSKITHPSIDYYPDTKAVFDYVNSKLETPLSYIESLKADFNSYKTSNDNAVNSKVDTTEFNAYKSATGKAIDDNAKSIKINATAIDKCVTDIAN